MTNHVSFKYPAAFVVLSVVIVALIAVLVTAGNSDDSASVSPDDVLVAENVETHNDNGNGEGTVPETQPTEVVEGVATSTPEPTPEPTLAPTATSEPVGQPTEVAQANDASDSVQGNTANVTFDPALASEGATVYLASCSACHGPDAHGIVGLGKDLVMSEFVHGLSNEDLLTFVKTGRPIWDPLNTTGIDMPPKGGNPALTDDQLLAVIHYLRSLQQQ
jgi:disulfide bond formation protein DsbB